MEDKIFDILTDLIRQDISKEESIIRLMTLFSDDVKQCNYCENEIRCNEGLFICRECSL